MKTIFTIHNEHQVSVENIISLNGQNLIDSLFTNINEEKSEITISIEDSNGESADFIVKKEDLQSIFDWLKLAQIIM